MYTAKDIRNLALLGHGGDGKSALCESMLYVTKAITRLGKRADGTTVSDFDDEEKKRQYSIKTSVIPVEFGGCKLNVLDNPGYFDFAAEIVQSLRVADAGLICLTAKSGIAVGTEKGWKSLADAGLPRNVLCFEARRGACELLQYVRTPCAISSAPPSSPSRSRSCTAKRPSALSISSPRRPTTSPARRSPCRRGGRED